MSEWKQMDLPEIKQHWVPVKQRSEFQRLQDELGVWADATFGDRSVNSLMFHLIEEIEEIMADNKDEMEWADALTLLIDGYRLATGNDTDQLIKSAFKKLEELKQRTWNPPDENGVIRHVKS